MEIPGIIGLGLGFGAGSAVGIVDPSVEASCSGGVAEPETEDNIDDSAVGGTLNLVVGTPETEVEVIFDAAIEGALEFEIDGIIDIDGKLLCVGDIVCEGIDDGRVLPLGLCDGCEDPIMLCLTLPLPLFPNEIFDWLLPSETLSDWLLLNEMSYELLLLAFDEDTGD